MGLRLLALQVALNLLLLASAVNFPVQSNVDLQKLSGLWLPIKSAHRGRETTQLEKIHEKAPFSLTALSGGNLQVGFHVKEKDAFCTEKKFPFERTKTAGIFTHGGITTVYIVETDYQNYLISAVEKMGLVAMYLAGRTGTLGGDIKKKYKELARKQGFPPIRIKNVMRDERCKPRN